MTYFHRAWPGPLAEINFEKMNYQNDWNWRK